MKIAIARQRYNPFGGAERFVERALAALAVEGAEVTLLTRNWDGALRQGFRQITCDPPYSRLFGGRVARDSSFAEAVQHEMLVGDYDITQTHERIPGCMIFRAGDGVHMAWLAHRARTLGLLGRFGQNHSFYHQYVLDTERAMFEHPELRVVICNSQMVMDEVNHYYGVEPSKLALIYNGVDTDSFHPMLAAEHRAVTRAHAGISEDVPVLLFVGSGFERKGVPQLLLAVSRMVCREVHLVIVGADRKAATMQSMALKLGLADRVLFAGALNDVRPWYGAADGFVLPTLYDPGPNAALEAMACGLPILTTKTCGARDWVREGENGFLVDALDVDEMAVQLDALCSLSANPRARNEARRAVEALTLEAMAGRLLDLYRSLLPL